MPRTLINLAIRIHTILKLHLHITASIRHAPSMKSNLRGEEDMFAKKKPGYRYSIQLQDFSVMQLKAIYINDQLCFKL